MQYAKDDVRNSMLAAAREEFIRQGFEKASIRAIASAAKTSKSNLYNYFPDKDALFSAVLAGAVGDIRRGLALADQANRDAGAKVYSTGGQAAAMRAVAEYVAGHTDDIRLLLFHSAGSSLAGFKDEVVEAFSGVLLDWFAGASPGRVPSRLLARCVADFYVTAVEQLLLAGPTEAQAGEYLAEFLRFVYGGWSGVLQQAPPEQSEMIGRKHDERANNET